MTQDRVRGLSALPSWDGATLDLTQCGPWPLTAAQYAQELSKYVPEGYKVLRFSKTKMHGKLRDVMAKGGKGVRAGVTVEIR